MDCSPWGSSVHENLQARILEWVAMPSSRGSSQARDRTLLSCIASLFFTADSPGKPWPPLTGRNNSTIPKSISEDNFLINPRPSNENLSFQNTSRNDAWIFQCSVYGAYRQCHESPALRTLVYFILSISLVDEGVIANVNILFNEKENPWCQK